MRPKNLTSILAILITTIFSIHCKPSKGHHYCYSYEVDTCLLNTNWQLISAQIDIPFSNHTLKATFPDFVELTARPSIFFDTNSYVACNGTEWLRAELIYSKNSFVSIRTIPTENLLIARTYRNPDLAPILESFKDLLSRSTYTISNDTLSLKNESTHWIKGCQYNYLFIKNPNAPIDPSHPKIAK